MLRLPPPLRARIHDAARACYPAEACGFLVGAETATGTETDTRTGTRTGTAVAGCDRSGAETGARTCMVVEEVIPAINRAEDQRRFLIEPRDVFEAMRSARAGGREIVGVYHSHPDAAAEPSATDRREAWGDWLHVIVSCASGELCETRCWRRVGDDFVAVTILQEAFARTPQRPQVGA